MTDLTPIFQAVISLAVLVVTVILIPLIRSKLTDAQYSRLQTAIGVGVFAAEQIYKGSGRGAEKKGYVLKLLNERGFTYDVGAIDSMIEAAVKQLNIAQGAGKNAVPS